MMQPETVSPDEHRDPNIGRKRTPSTIPSTAMFCVTPQAHAKAYGYELPPESSAIQMRLMVAGLVAQVEAGEIDASRLKFGSYYHPLPVDGELLNIARSILDSSNRVVAWRMGRNRDGRLRADVAHELMMKDRFAEFSAIHRQRFA